MIEVGLHVQALFRASGADLLLRQHIADEAADLVGHPRFRAASPTRGPSLRLLEIQGVALVLLDPGLAAEA